MLIHKDTLIADEVLRKAFVCDLKKCKGICCVEGDYGAPMEADEVETIEKYLEEIRPYMDDEGRELLNEEGFHEEDPDGDIVTTCRNGRECVFVTRGEDGIYKCAIEQAYFDGKIDFRKPISCHLYPVRLQNLKEFTALNYDEWNICSPACSLGNKLDVPIYKFVKDALIRKFGQEWYDELVEITEGLSRQQK